MSTGPQFSRGVTYCNATKGVVASAQKAGTRPFNHSQDLRRAPAIHLLVAAYSGSVTTYNVSEK